MSDYVLSCCSSADLSKDHFESIGVVYVCPHYFLGGREYPDDLGQSVSFPDFYKAMADGAETRTSQCSITQYLDHFTPFLEQGKDILHVTLSSGISGTYNSAVSAAEIAGERFPDRKIYIVDSLGASSGYGLIMDTLAGLRDSGMGLEDLRDWTEAHKLNMHHFFFSTDLTYFIRGGRISKAAGVFGGVLNICPLMRMDAIGRLVPKEKIRTKKRVIRAIVDRMETYADNGLDYDGKCYISMSACLEDAQAVARLVEERFPKLNGKVEINNIGNLIGSHTGPGTVALFFWGRKRED